MHKFILALSCILMMLAAPISVQDFQKGYEAYQNEDHATALKEQSPLAEGGNNDARYNLGAMYYNGQGVLADFVIAHMWFNIARAIGNEIGADNRAIIAKEITPEDISKAQTMARICMNSNYKQCGN